MKTQSSIKLILLIRFLIFTLLFALTHWILKLSLKITYIMHFCNVSDGADLLLHSYVLYCTFTNISESYISKCTIIAFLWLYIFIFCIKEGKCLCVTLRVIPISLLAPVFLYVFLCAPIFNIVTCFVDSNL